jgi:hypothetical protein
MVNKNLIPAGGSLQLTFNGYTPSYSNITINALTSGAFINVSALSVPSSNVFFFSSFFSSQVAAGTTLTFSISSIMTAPTTSSTAYSITILTSAKSSYLNRIDQSTCSIANIANFPTASLSVVPATTMKVGSSNVLLYVNFIAPTTIDFTTDTILVSVDSGSTYSLSIYYLLVTVTTNVTSIGMFGANSSSGVTFPTSAPSQTIASGTAVQITSGLFATSSVNSGSKTVAIYFSRSGSSYSYNTASFTVNPNVLTAASLSVLSSTVSTVTTYTFTMTINNPLGSGAAVKITLPSSVSIATGTCTVVASLSIVNALSSNVLCSASTSQIILVSNISNSVLATGTVITLAVSNINNPTTTKAISSLLYQTYYSLTQLTNPVDDSTGFTIVFTPSAITIPSSNFVLSSRTSTTNRQYASYTFKYTVYTTFPANGYMTIIMPAAMVLSSGATANYVLSTVGTNNTVSMTSTTTLAATTLKLNFNGLVPSTLSSGTIFTITISNILNYYSFKSITMQLIVYTSDDFAIEQSDAAAVSVTNTVSDTTLTVGTSNSNTVNGKTVVYNFTVTTPVGLTASDQLSIELVATSNVNTQLLYSSAVSCTLAGAAAVCSKDAGNDKLLIVTTGAAVAASTPTSLGVTSVMLTRCQAQPGNILFKTYEMSNGTAYLISSYTLTPPANSAANLITTAALAIIDNGISSARLDQPTAFTLSLSPTNTLITGDFIVVTVPATWTNIQSSMVTVTNVSNIGSMTGSLCSDLTVFCSNYLSDPNKIRIDDKTGTAFPSVTNISFTITNSAFASPKDWLTTYASLGFATYSNSSNAIDASTNATNNTAAFSLACPNSTSFHCKTCNSTGTCTACYQTGDGYDPSWNFGGFVVRQSTGECVSSCGGNYFNSSNFCVQCTAPCYGCTGSLTTQCTSCIAPKVLSGTTCLTACADGYYNNTGVCTVCTSPCKTCSGAATTCLSCNNGTYYNNNTNVCGADCSAVAGTFADNSTWACTSCVANCSTCSVSASNCTSCSSTYFQTGTNICTQNCPTGTAKLNSTTCTCNFTVCATCVLTINTCLTCQTGLVLLNSSCLSSCGNGYYNSSNTCVACVTNCQTCSAGGCSVCYSTAPILYNSSCYAACPSGSSQSGNTCITCPTGCSVCSSTTICTSCLTIYYLMIYNNGTTECTRPCPSPYLQQSSICVSSCTAPLVADSSGQNCITSNTSTNTTTTVTLISDTSKVVPFPVTIALAVLIIVTLASKVALPDTLLPAAFAAFAGFCEILSWLIFILSIAVDSNSESLGNYGLIIVVIAYILTILLNIISIIFFKKYLWTDDKFQNHLKKLRTKTRCGVVVTYLVLIFSVVFSFKII